MYDVSLINLSADAHSAADSFRGKIPRPGLSEAALALLLHAFADIDAVENAVAAPEIRVAVGNERYLLRTGQHKLMLYDNLRREVPAFVLTVDEAMAELNGSAQALRHEAIRQHQSAVVEAEALAPRPPSVPAVPASKRRLVVLGVAACALLGTIISLQIEGRRAPSPLPFHAVNRTEARALLPGVAGVYMTGNQPGQHGIVVLAAGRLKLFELDTRAAPRVVYATGRLGRTGPRLALATDQPGGLIEVTDPNTLVYCGEVYRRIP